MTLMSTHLCRRKASPFLKSQVKTLMMLCDKIESACDGDATGWSDSLVMDGTFDTCVFVQIETRTQAISVETIVAFDEVM